MRVVWVSFDTIGRDCLLAAVEAGAEIAGIVTLPGPIDPNRSGQCSFSDVAIELRVPLVETETVNAPISTRDSTSRPKPSLPYEPWSLIRSSSSAGHSWCGTS